MHDGVHYGLYFTSKANGIDGMASDFWINPKSGLCPSEATTSEVRNAFQQYSFVGSAKNGKRDATVL
jgi:hypothetical protein